jgi:hypothetical protein
LNAEPLGAPLLEACVMGSCTLLTDAEPGSFFACFDRVFLLLALPGRAALVDAEVRELRFPFFEAMASRLGWS